MKTDFKKGDVLVYQSRREGYPHLTIGKEYEAIADQEAGIFASDPYIRVIMDNGNPCACHASRFKLKTVAEV